MDIKQLEAFCMVVRQGSFSKAARVLGVSQPTVSAHISPRKGIGVRAAHTHQQEHTAYG